MKKVLVYLASSENQIKRSSFETLCAARELCDKSGAELEGLAFNISPESAGFCAECGLENLKIINDEKFELYNSSAYSAAIAEHFNAVGADALAVSGNDLGLELAPLCAAKLDAAYAPDLIGYRIDGSDLIVKKYAYSGKILVEYKMLSDRKVLSFRPNLFPITTSGKKDMKTVEIKSNIPGDEFTLKLIDRSKDDGTLDIAEADYVVAAGRGAQSAENYQIVTDFAKSINAALGASRAIVDSGFRPHSEQVGQTGKTIAPKLYVACAISGAVQHLAGIGDAKTILAINKDRDAQIFKNADYGIVGDIANVLPKLSARIQKIKTDTL
jgi:electron transfer flavoprotein alpha subunit